MGFAEDITIVSVAKTVREIEEKMNAVIRNVGAWLDEASLKLAAHKMEVVLISGAEDSGEDGSDRCFSNICHSESTLNCRSRHSRIN